MSAGFTPGPWEVISDYPRSTFWRVAAPRLPGSNVFINITLVESEDDARLIAAAPELHEALGDMLRIIEAMRLTTGLGKGQTARVDKARAALAKARGDA